MKNDSQTRANIILGYAAVMVGLAVASPWLWPVEATVAYVTEEDDAFDKWYELNEIETVCLHETEATPRYEIKTCGVTAYYPIIQ